MKRPLPVMLTVEDLESLPDDGNRYEVVDGELFVSTSPSLIHQRILAELLTEIRIFLRSHPIGEILPGVGVILDEHNAVIPDLLYFRKDRFAAASAGGRFTQPPDIAIEILSPGAANERRDRNVKLNLYSEFGVREYWIADPENRGIEIYRNQNAGLALQNKFGAGEILRSEELPGFTSPVQSFFD